MRPISLLIASILLLQPLYSADDNLFPKDTSDFSYERAHLVSHDQDNKLDDSKDDQNGRRFHQTLGILEVEEDQQIDHLSQAYLRSFEFEENLPNKLNLVKYGASIVGLGAGIPYIASSMSAGEFYLGTGSAGKSLGVIFSLATCLFSGGVTAWSAWELCEEFIKKPHYQLIFDNTQNKSKKCILCRNILYTILGCVSSIPQVYVAYHYNARKEIVILGFLFESVIRSFGFHKFASTFNFECRKNNYLQRNQKVVERILDKSKISFLEAIKKIDTSELGEFIDGFQNLSTRELYKKLESSDENLSLIHEQVVYAKDYMGGTPRELLRYGSLIFPIGGLVVNFILAYQGIDLVLNTPTLSGTIAAATIIPGFILDSYATQQVVMNGFDNLYNCLNKISTGNYFDAIYPKTYKSILLGSFILAATSTFATSYVALDNLNDHIDDPSLKEFLVTLTSISAVKMGSYGIASTLFNFSEVILKKNNPLFAYAVNCCNKLLQVGLAVKDIGIDCIISFKDKILDLSGEFT